MTTPAALAVIVEGATAAARIDLPSAEMTRQMAPGVVVNSQASAEQVGEIIKAIKVDWNRADEMRKTWTGPLTDVVRSINAAFAPRQKALAESEQILKEKLAAYTQQVAIERVEAMRTGAPASAPVEVQGVSIRTERRFRVVNEDAVPRQFCSPDPAKIAAHIAAGGLEAIVGVEFYDHQITSVRVK
jgi:hypothetical protein